MLQETDYKNVNWRNLLRLLEAIFADLVGNEIKQLSKTCDCANLLLELDNPYLKS